MVFLTADVYSPKLWCFQLLMFIHLNYGVSNFCLFTKIMVFPTSDVYSPKLWCFQLLMFIHLNYGVSNFWCLFTQIMVFPTSNVFSPKLLCFQLLVFPTFPTHYVYWEGTHEGTYSGVCQGNVPLGILRSSWENAISYKINQCSLSHFSNSVKHNTPNCCQRLVFKPRSCFFQPVLGLQVYYTKIRWNLGFGGFIEKVSKIPTNIILTSFLKSEKFFLKNCTVLMIK